CCRSRGVILEYFELW
nr:immunoglobulin heavy chain junction region [Macaca mulatta]MOW99534.1 immunoglobulin heavy chain junction region [Macaca mulatta]MOX00181.1 immunoglobulin heavy chain junction region [Macaca mulatta]MOX00343.1 immunoglobulin heavy chain junction region [Macaca mulatta]MOX00408.1 immunoglobulin heavy chain junction region [Macaca mulatta]